MHSSLQKLCGDALIEHNRREHDKSLRPPPRPWQAQNAWDPPGINMTLPMKMRMTTLGPVYFATLYGTVYGKKYEWDVMTTLSLSVLKDMAEVPAEEWAKMLSQLAQSLLEAFDAEVFEQRTR